MATELSIERGRLALPHLVHHSEMRKTITYGELAGKIGCHPRVLRLVLEYIRDELCLPRSLPLLTAIVVRKSTGLPGDGWLPGGTSHLSPEEYRRKFEEVRDQVFACDAWYALLTELGLSPVQGTESDLDEQGRARSLYLEREGQAGEGPLHRQLKEHVAQNPGSIGLEASGLSEQEYLFVCGDRCDVVFSLGEGGHAVVEIKTGERGDLVRGIYQVIKYRALMEAEKGHGDACSVSAYLVAYDIPEDVAALAKRFNVRCFSAPRSMVFAEV